MSGSSFHSSEKRPVVIQLGKWYTKVGFASEPHPRAILHTPELQSRETMTLGSATLSSQQWDLIFASLIRRIYFHHLKIAPIDRRVILLENVLMPRTMRDSLSRVLFEQLKVPSIVYMSEMSSPLYTCGIPSGIVVDVGFQETRVMPVCFGVPLFRAYQTNRVGCQTINDALRQMLIKSIETGEGDQIQKSEGLARLETLPDTIIDDMKSKCCYVRFMLPVPKMAEAKENKDEDAAVKETEDEASEVKEIKDEISDIKDEISEPKEIKDEALTALDKQKLLESSIVNGVFTFESNEDLEYPVSHLISVTVPKQVRWESCECLFTPPLPTPGEALPDGLIDAIINAIEACPLDVKRHVIENLVLCGGGAEIRGLLHRVTIELRDALRRHSLLSPLADRLAIGNPQFKPILLQWIGASAASTAMEQEAYVPNELLLRHWEAGDTPPDWTLPESATVRVFELRPSDTFISSRLASTEV